MNMLRNIGRDCGTEPYVQDGTGKAVILIHVVTSRRPEGW